MEQLFTLERWLISECLQLNYTKRHVLIVKKLRAVFPSYKKPVECREPILVVRTSVLRGGARSYRRSTIRIITVEK